jgi:hypothetical protein
MDQARVEGSKEGSDRRCFSAGNEDETGSSEGSRSERVRVRIRVGGLEGRRRFETSHLAGNREGLGQGRDDVRSRGSCGRVREAVSVNQGEDVSRIVNRK